MKFRSILNGYEFEAVLTTDHAASSYGQAVLVETERGEAIDQFSAALAEVVEATEVELAALTQAGYHCRKSKLIPPKSAELNGG